MARGRGDGRRKSIAKRDLNDSGSSVNFEEKLPAAKKRKIAGNKRNFKQDEEYEIEKILSYRLAPAEKNVVILEFLIKWRNWAPEWNSWEPLENLRYNSVFIEFINSKFREFEMEIFVNIANIKEKIKSKIRKTLSENLKFVIMLDVFPFDPFEYKTHQVFFHLMSNPPLEFIEHLENLVFRNYFFKLDEVQRVKLDKIAEEISEKEKIKVSIENDMDFSIDFSNFTYVTKNALADDFDNTFIEPDSTTSNEVKGCKCGKGKCSPTSEKCCPQLSKEPFAYKECRGQTVLRLNRQDAIIECNSNCSCGPKCMNRVTQQETRDLSLCLFKTENRGFGIKTLKPIKKGTFIIEYCGELLGHHEAGKREVNSYLFDLNMERKSNGYYTIDAYKMGNIGRFVNHSCEPNASMWFINDCVRDPKNQKLCIYSLIDIPKDEEITIDYCPYDTVPTSNRMNYSQSFEIDCLCGSKICRGTVY